MGFYLVALISYLSGFCSLGSLTLLHFWVMHVRALCRPVVPCASAAGRPQGRRQEACATRVRGGADGLCLGKLVTGVVASQNLGRVGHHRSSWGKTSSQEPWETGENAKIWGKIYEVLQSPSLYCSVLLLALIMPDLILQYGFSPTVGTKCLHSFREGPCKSNHSQKPL